MNRTDSQSMITILIAAENEGRWTPRSETRQAMNGAEQALAIRIQAGQPDLEAMNDSLLSDHADRLLSEVRADFAACRFASPNLDEIRLFGETSVIAHDFSRRPVPALARAA